MKKIVLIVIGVVAALGGLALAIGGVALMAIFGTDGIYDSPTNRIDTATHALVSEPVELKHDAPWGSGFGDITVRLRARASEGNEVFLGVAPAEDVDDYLRGAAHDVVDEWRYDGDDDAISKTRVDGDAIPAPPAEQDFWSVDASGPGEQRIEWELREGTYRLVVMNSDATPGVDVRGRWGVEIPWIFPLGIGLLAGGVVVLAIGIVVLVIGVRIRTQPAAPAPPETVGDWTLR